MNLVPWRDRSAVGALTSDLESWMDDFWKERASALPEVFRRGPLPAVNLAENGKEFVATVEVPGLEEKDLQVQIVGNQLVVSGERKWEEEKKDKEYFRVESQYGAFKRVLALPDGLNLDPDAVVAKLAKGVLEIRIQKSEPKPTAKIKVVATK
jgi:HSP20 family protein